MPTAARSAHSSPPRHLAWLRQLRWVSPLETWLVLLATGLVVVTSAGAAWQRGTAFALLAPLAHLPLLGAIVLAAARWLCLPLLGLTCLSLINYSVLLLVQLQVAAVDNVYYAFGLAAGLICTLRIRPVQRAWELAQAYDEQDDYRWLLTEAPLWLRWRMRSRLRAWPAA